MVDFSGKTAVVTGASRGIGEACARLFDAAGARLVLVARSTENMGKLAATFAREAVVVTANLIQNGDTEAAVAQVLSAVDGVDFLINNAGVNWNEPPDAITGEWLDVQLDVNLRNLILFTSRLLPSLIERRGAVVNISSVAAWGGGVEESVYAATKGAVNAYTANLGRALGPKGVRVNGVAPGLIDTAIWNTRFAAGGKKSVMEELAKDVPLRRWGTAEEVASVVGFLCSGAASYVTGETLRVGGGLT
ncbi:MAG: SDR family NAD(P)-dependent oxidoreductase [Acidimicrobiales bacterium]